MAKKLVDELEECIVAGDWVGVCAVYFKLTGKNVVPPTVAAAATPVVENPLDWGKTKLYNWLKKEYNIAGPSKSYSLEDLQDIYKLNNEVDEEDELITFEVTPPTQPQSSGFTYTPPGKAGSLLKMDKKPIRQKLTDFKIYNDENVDPVPRTRDATNKVSASCRQCGLRDNVHPSVIIGGSSGQDKKYICSKCSP